jgi:hypothetical protein
LNRIFHPVCGDSWCPDYAAMSCTVRFIGGREKVTSLA